MEPTSQTGPFFETNVISLLQTNVIVETSNLMLQCLIQKMCLINLTRISGLKGLLHTTTFSKYTELLQLKNIFEYFEIIFEICKKRGHF